jgi:hypothetical protein
MSFLARRRTPHFRAVIVLSDYIDYFRDCCVQHPDLRHSEHSDGRVFEVRSFDAAFGDFRSAVAEKRFFVRLLLPTMKFSAQGNNALKHYQFGLMVGRWFSRREDGDPAQSYALSEAERVADNILEKVQLDSRAGHPLMAGMADSVAGMDVNGDFFTTEGDGAYGAILYTFTLSAFRQVQPGCEYSVWGGIASC